MDLSILPPFLDFFFLSSDDLVLSTGKSSEREFVIENTEGQYCFQACGLALVCKILWLRFHPKIRIQSCIPIAERLVWAYGIERLMPHVTREGVEIRAVLEVVKVLIELMLPYDAPCPIQIDKLEVESSLRVLRERKATL